MLKFSIPNSEDLSDTTIHDLNDDLILIDTILCIMLQF